MIIKIIPESLKALKVGILTSYNFKIVNKPKNSYKVGVVT